MKHKFIIAAIAATGMTLMTSCNSKGKDEAKDGKQPTEQADKLKANFMSEDLKTFGLQGNVKMSVISEMQENGEYHRLYVIKFDEQGRLTDLNDYRVAYDEKHPDGIVTNETGLPVKRDEKGRLLAIEQMGGCSKGYFFEYMDDGSIRFTENPDDYCEGVPYTIWKRDANNLPTDEEFEIYEIGYSCNSTTAFTYTNFDEHNNWTERTGKCHMTEDITEEDFEDGELEETTKTQESDKEVKQQQIVYYY